MTYDEQIKVIEEDLKGKLFRRDWHGVMDCAADLRELEALHKGELKGFDEGRQVGFEEAMGTRV